MRFVGAKSWFEDTGSEPINRVARSFRSCVQSPRVTPYSTQPTSTGKCDRICSALHSGICPLASGNAMTLMTAHSGMP